MGPAKAIKTCFVKYADFSGRATRPEFWWFVAFQIVCFVGLSFVDSALFPILAEPKPPTLSPLSEVFGLVILLPTFSLLSRRIQDTGNPSRTALILLGAATLLGYTFTIIDFFGVYDYTNDVIFVALSFCSLAVMCAIFVFALKKSEPGENEWGAFPEGG